MLVSGSFDEHVKVRGNGAMDYILLLFTHLHAYCKSCTLHSSALQDDMTDHLLTSILS